MTEAAPNLVSGVYQIDNEQNLLWVLKRDFDSIIGKNFKLNVNINFRLTTTAGSDAWWKKILGNKENPTNVFGEVFDGNFHKIYFEEYKPVLNYDYPRYQSSLFQAIRQGEIKNFNFEIGNNVVLTYDPYNPYRDNVTFGLFAGKLEGGVVENNNFSINGIFAVRRWRENSGDAGFLFGCFTPDGGIRPEFKNNIVRFGNFTLQHYTKGNGLQKTIYNISPFVGALRDVTSEFIFKNNLFFRENAATNNIQDILLLLIPEDVGDGFALRF